MLSLNNFKSELVKYIIVLTTGTALAQLINVLFSPLLTRIYTDEEFGEYGLYFRIISLGAALATFRYELSIPLPKEDKTSYRLYKFAFNTTVITVIASSLVVLIPFLFESQSSYQLFYLLIPIGIAFIAFQNIGTYWALRLKKFRHISYNKVVAAVSGGAMKIVLGKLAFGYIGIIGGLLFGLVVSSFWFLRDLVQANRQFKIKFKNKGTLAVAKSYDQFPKVNLPHILMDLGRDLLVATIILQLFSKGDFGQYDLSYRMLQLPLAVIGVSVSQVFFQHCSELVNQGKSVDGILIRSLKKLTILGIIPFLGVFLFGEEIFSVVFGENWKSAGEFAEVLAPWVFLKFVSSPITSIPLIIDKQREFFLWSILGASLMIMALYLPHILNDVDLISTLWILSISQSIYLIFMIFKIIGFTRN